MSRTRVALDAAAVGELVRAALGSQARVASAAPLGGGTFNACWEVALASGEALVLKVAPPPTLALLTYEQDLLRTEVDFYARAAAVGVPVPRVVATAFDRRVIASDYFLMTRLPGVRLDAAQKRLSKEQRDAVRADLGRVIARLDAVRGEHFGYEPVRIGTRAETWREAFGAMFAKLLADAARLDVALPRSASELTAIVGRCAPAVDEVRTPRLVHFDLWDGNILVDAGASPPRVCGIIDGERAFEGDPLAELASLALFREIESDDAFLRGYAEALGRPLAFSDAERQRIALAQLYLYLIMRIEPATRGRGGVVGFVVQRLVMRSLRRVLRKLDALSRAASTGSARSASQA